MAVLRRMYMRHVFNTLSVALGIGGLFYFFLKADTHDARASAIASIALGVICAGLWVLYVFSAVRSAVKKSFAADPQLSAEREVLITPEGFRERTAINDSFHTWPGLTLVHLTARHLLVFNTQLTAYIVPRSHVSPEALSVVRASVPRDRMRNDQGA